MARKDPGAVAAELRAGSVLVTAEQTNLTTALLTTRHWMCLFAILHRQKHSRPMSRDMPCPSRSLEAEKNAGRCTTTLSLQQAK